MTEEPKDKKPPGKPPVLTPPDAGERAEPGHSRTGLWLVAACGFLLVIVALLVLCWPLLQKEPVEIPVSKSPEQPPAASSPVADVGSVSENEAAAAIDQLLGEWLRKQAAAEAENIAGWGGLRYAEAVSLAQDCDRLLGDKQFLPARQACDLALSTLGQLMASKQVLLAEAVQMALQALAQGDPETARSHFGRALAIDAGNEQALSGLRRANNLPEVLRLIEVGFSKEQSGDVAGALQAFTEAVALDAEFAPAQAALERVSGAIAEQKFRQSMSRALQALAEGRFATAQAALQQAQTLQPNARAVRDLRQQLNQAQLAANLERLRQDAESHAQSERWSDALSACEQALRLDAQVAFAAGCRDRAKLRIDLDARLKAMLAQPERLFADGPLKEARELVAYAAEVTPSGPRLSAQLAQLTKLIRQAEEEVAVVILSDGLTDVVIYHVGRMGRFQEKKLLLRTGDYTAVGSRNGFRDVRLTLKVRPGSDAVFTLRCEEPI